MSPNPNSNPNIPKKITTVITDCESLHSFVTEHCPDTNVDIWWTCPKCGTKNYGVYHCRSAVCPCGKYEYPSVSELKKYPVEEVGRSRQEIEEDIRDISGKLREAYCRHSEIESEKDRLESEITRCQETLGKLQKSYYCTGITPAKNNNEGVQA